MKTAKSLIMIIVSVFFIASLGSPAWAEPISLLAKKGVQQLPREEPGYRHPVMQCQVLMITTPAKLSPVTVDTPYSKQIQVSGGRQPVSFSSVDNLPAGLNLSSQGVISGTPTKVGNYKFLVKVTDSCQPTQTVQKMFSLNVGIDWGGKPPSIAVSNPVIESFFTIPNGEPLKQGTRLYLEGKHFGTQPGKILMYGDFPINPVELVYVNWESKKKVDGVVPVSANGAPNQTISIKVKTADGRLSNPKEMKFVGREEKMVRRDDVLVLQCGDDGNCNCCNHILTTEDYSGDATKACEGAHSSVAIVGLHLNVALAIGDDAGFDRYSIHLNNGWVFKEVTVDKQASSSDEHIGGPVPSCPIGQSDWNPEFNWLVTQGDYIRYKVYIHVEGPLGTDYK
jgi:hypothetical protein